MEWWLDNSFARQIRKLFASICIRLIPEEASYVRFKDRVFFYLGRSFLKTPDLRMLSERFSDYRSRHGEDRIRYELHCLTDGLDEKSIATAERMLSRYHSISKSEILDEREWFDYPDPARMASISKEIEGLKTRLKRPGFMSELNEDIFYYESGLLFIPEKIVSERLDGRDIIDCGAYNGDSALSFSIHHNPRRIYCFEPVQANHMKLLETIKTCNLRGAIPIKKGVGDRQERKKIVGRDSGSRISDGPHGETIDITDIDSFIRKNGAVPGLIKMDIEGYESRAIEGAIGSIKRYRPILLIAIYHTPEDFFGIKCKIEKEVGGYRFMIRHLVRHHPVCETALIGYPDEESEFSASSRI